jgi:hypothetical protein
MKPTDFIISDERPNALHLRRLALTSGRDRLCLVREPLESRCTGVAVVLFGPKAVREVGPFLLEHVKQLTPHTGQTVDMTLDRTIPELMLEMDAQKMDWAWSPLEFTDGARATFCIILGASITAPFAEQLTKLGVTCNLT